MEDKIKRFKQHGFRETKPSGKNHSLGDCVFCGKAEKMSINVDTLQWDCKVCQRNGGSNTFLSQISENNQKNMKGKPLLDLSESKGLDTATLKEIGIGYNKVTSQYTIPVYSLDGTVIQDLRIYNNKRIMSTFGCKTGLYGWEHIKEETEIVWICEGEWDSLCLVSHIDMAKEVVVAVPGANTFKNEWARLFQEKDVRVVYDNDEPGRLGMIKVYNNLKHIAKRISFIKWDNNQEGYDVRDHYTRPRFNKSKITKILAELMQDKPLIKSGDNIVEAQESPKSQIKELIRDISQVYKDYKKWLFLEDTSVLDVLFGTIACNRLDGDPLWLFLVAPPGGTKTELLMSLSDIYDIKTITTMTPHSLISGANFAGGGDPSLIPQLNEKVLVIKDFTTILNMNIMARDEIFGILRDAYDGKTEKQFGNGVFRSYQSKFGMIAGVTPAIELFAEDHSALGERFLRFNIPISKSRKSQRVMLRQAMKNINKETDMRKDLKNAANLAINGSLKGYPKIPEAIEDRALFLAQFVSIIRGTVIRDKYTKDITHNSFSELGTRVVKQFCKMLMGIGSIKDKKVVSMEEYEPLKAIARDTIPSRLELIIQTVYKNKMVMIDNKDVSEINKLPPITCSRLLENLALLGVMDKHKEGLRTKFNLSEEILEIIESSEVYK